MTDAVPAPVDNRPYSPGLEGVIAGETVQLHFNQVLTPRLMTMEDLFPPSMLEQ